MATKIELIVQITDDEKGVAKSAFAMSGDDYETTKDDFSDHVFYRGPDFVQRALEHPKFENAKTKPKQKRTSAQSRTAKVKEDK